MTIPPISGIEKYVTEDGRLTFAGQVLLQEMITLIERNQDTLAAIAAVSSPSGGATVDAESRTAIDAIITAAGT